MSDKLAAIIVNFNRSDLLRGAIDSLVKQTFGVGKVFVVDNASTDDSLSKLGEASESAIEVLKLPENLGASGGFQRGVETALAADADRLLLMDSDVALAPDCVERLYEVMGRSASVGVTGPKVYNLHSMSILQEFGGWVNWTTADLRRNCWRHDESVGGVVAGDCEVDYVPACCLLARRSAIEKAGNFDPDWFLYWDDIDWCTRVRNAGFSVEAVASARVHHFGGGANKTNLLPVYYGWRNRAVYFIRNSPPDILANTMRALFGDFLLARFSCRELGLPRTASVMELGIEDALNGVFGKKDFSGTDLSLDRLPQNLDSLAVTGIEETVHHVIGSATPELARQSNVELVDRFGKRLPAVRALELRNKFEASDLQTLDDWVSRGVELARKVR